MFESKEQNPAFQYNTLQNPNFPNQTIYAKSSTSMLKLIRISSYPYLKVWSPTGKMKKPKDAPNQYFFGSKDSPSQTLPFIQRNQGRNTLELDGSLERENVERGVAEIRVLKS